MIELLRYSPVYLAAPYTSPDKAIEAQRVELANRYAAILMERLGLTVFSPISHSAGIVKHLAKETITSHEFWMAQCIPMVRNCAALVVLTVEGWQSSKGVQLEIAAAEAVRIPILEVRLGYPEHGHGHIDWSEAYPLQKMQEHDMNDVLLISRVREGGAIWN